MKPYWLEITEICNNDIETNSGDILLIKTIVSV